MRTAHFAPPCAHDAQTPTKELRERTQHRRETTRGPGASQSENKQSAKRSRELSRCMLDSVKSGEPRGWRVRTRLTGSAFYLPSDRSRALDNPRGTQLHLR